MKKYLQASSTWFLSGVACIGMCIVVMVYTTSHVAEAQQIDTIIENLVTIERAWSPETIPGRSNGVVYLDITNSSDEVIQLTSVSSENARKASLHESLLEDGVMKMRSLSSMTIPPGETVSLEPGGKHVMLMDLKSPFEVGNFHPLVLNFSKGQSHEVGVVVFPLSQLSFPDQR
jgi:copper(I)-binding protein